MSDLERLVLEKHQLMAQNRELSNLLVAACQKLADEKGIVRFTKRELEGTVGHGVTVERLKSGLKMTVGKSED